MKCSEKKLNSIKKDERVPLLNFEGVPGPWSEGPEVLGPEVLVPLLHHVLTCIRSSRPEVFYVKRCS